jgi:hypothetical protein
VAPVVEAEEEEDTEAKALLQGIWIVGDTEEVAFRADGDTIYYPDPTDQPAFFRIVHDSLELSGNRYPIIKQGEHVFWFQNQGGDIMQLVKSESPDDSLTFVHQQPVILTPTEVLKMDSVVYYGGERYHWYVAVNPTKYRVLKNSYNSEGVGVQNVYFDNIIHISLYQGKKCIYSHDLKKQMYEDKVPQDFLDQAILGNMQYDHTDADGVHFNATLCVPDEASCYMVETLVGFDGKLSMKLLEY